ncbi:hypothetical protein D3C76_799700 [compost metagenome]
MGAVGRRGLLSYGREADRSAWWPSRPGNQFYTDVTGTAVDRHGEQPWHLLPGLDIHWRRHGSRTI